MLRPPTSSFDPSEEPGASFGQNVLSLSVMQKRLPKSVHTSVLATIEGAAPLDASVADMVAAAMNDGALEKGATHDAHLFYALTGLTAEKHDTFLDPVGDDTVFASFSGKTLRQGEPDASSPAYVLENPNGNTLRIPTVFISMTGEALDHKTPILGTRTHVVECSAERASEGLDHQQLTMATFTSARRRAHRRGALSVLTPLGLDALAGLAARPPRYPRCSTFWGSGDASQKA